MCKIALIYLVNLLTDGNSFCLFVKYKKCLLFFSEKINYTSNSLRIYMSIHEIGRSLIITVFSVYLKTWVEA
jgi:hypothetical protein